MSVIRTQIKFQLMVAAVCKATTNNKILMEICENPRVSPGSQFPRRNRVWIFFQAAFQVFSVQDAELLSLGRRESSASSCVLFLVLFWALS